MIKKTEQKAVRERSYWILEEEFFGEKKEVGLMFSLFLKFVGWVRASISAFFQSPQMDVSFMPLEQRFTEKNWEEEYESSLEDAESRGENGPDHLNVLSIQKNRKDALGEINKLRKNM